MENVNVNKNVCKFRSYYRGKYLISLYGLDGLCTGTYDNVYHLCFVWDLPYKVTRSKIDRIFRREMESIKIDGYWYDVFFTRVTK